MNTVNNVRRRRSREKLTEALIRTLQTKELSEIRVQELCRMAGVNRSTFYACFQDIYGLAEEAQKKLKQEVASFYYRENEDDDREAVFLQLFRHVAENQLLYKTYFKLGLPVSFDPSEADLRMAEKYYEWKDIDYHVAFFRAGLNAVIEKWLAEGCCRPPEEINEIISMEYRAKNRE